MAVIISAAPFSVKRDALLKRKKNIVTKDLFAGSDEGRNAEVLKYAQSVTFEAPLELEGEGVLPSVTVAYETYGRLSETKDNAVLICHALSGDSHVSAHDENDDPGWWDIFVGPGKAVDTDKLFVICPNVLGSCRGTTGPNSTNPATGAPYGQDFPEITIGDMVEVQRRLIEHLGIEKLLAVVGGSMGGHMALHWAASLPQQVRGVVAMASSPRLSSQALAFDIVGRNAIRQDPNFHDGQFYDRDVAPDTGLAIARMLGHITYLSSAAMSEKFEATRNQPRNVDTVFEKEFAVGSYLAYKGQKFTERFDANSYLTLSLAMDRFDLGHSLEQLACSFREISARCLVISYSSDWLFPPSQSRQIVSALIHEGKPVSYCNVESDCGHDAFLLDDDLPIYGEMIRAFLLNILGAEYSPARDPDDENHSPTSIFHQSRRLDYDRILELIHSDDSVLDLGCGTGGLLARLKGRGNTCVRGVEIDQRNILACVQRGLDVVHRNLNEDLRWFGDNQFDVVVLSQTIQTVYDVERMMDEMLRVGRKCIVSIPNFAYFKLQDMLTREGRTPESALLHFKWYDTPNIRVLTLKDFEDFCSQKNIRIHKQIALDLESGVEISQDQDPNRNADMAIYVIS